MLKQEDTWAKVCDACRSAACTVYCRADSAYLCTGCDARIHAANKVASHHERVWVCEACERAPAAFLCKADAASLCTTCDSDIHSANPLARRHHRVPVLPIPGTLYGPAVTTDPGGSIIGQATEDADHDDGFLSQDVDGTIDDNDEDEAASWLLLNPINKNNSSSSSSSNNNNNKNNGILLGGEEVDEYSDLVEYSLCRENQYINHHDHLHQHQNFTVPQKSYGGDSLVPDHFGGRGGKDQFQLQNQQQNQYQQSFQLRMEYEASNTGFAYPASMSHSVSFSSMECGGVVPESTVSDVSIPHHRPPKGAIDLFVSNPIQMPQQLTPMDREARVLRYREKKKTRKFEKTIRYASRKAYAETRPRIKGRFAKRTDVEVEEVDQMLSTALMVESGYGVVPSF